MKSLRPRLFALPCLTLLCLFAAATEVRADPVVITSGFFTSTVSGGGVTSALMTGDGISISGGTGDYMAIIGPHRPGDILSINFNYAGLDSITVNGYHNDYPYAVGNTFNFAGGSIVVPSDAVNPTITLPFTFTGHVAVFAMTGPPTPLVSADLVGQGTATLSFITIDIAGATRIQQLSRVTYTFAPTAPTPEPASLLLLASGLTGACAEVRRRRRAREVNRR